MLLPFVQTAPPSAPFAADLFLVGSNPRRIQELNWLDPKNAEPDTPIQATLRAEVAPLMAARRPFIVIDGGDGSPFATAKPWNEVKVCQKDYSSYDSATESFTVRGVTKTRVLARTTTETTTTGGVNVGTNGKMGYVAQNFLHFGSGENHPIVALMDLNSFGQASAHGQDQDKRYLPCALLFSDDSTVQTARYLERTETAPSGPVLCRTGIPRAGDREVYAFPPAGVVSRYRLVREGVGWRLEFVAFYRAKA